MYLSGRTIFTALTLFYVLFSNVVGTNVQTSGIPTVYRPFWALSSASVGTFALITYTNSGYNRDQGVTAQILAFTLTILILTHDNHQQIHLFVDGGFLLSILCFQPVGNTCSQNQHSTLTGASISMFNRNKQSTNE